MYITYIYIINNYLKKIIGFLFAFGDYSLIHMSKDGENSISIVSTLVLNTTQIKLKNKIIYLGKHYKIFIIL